jgi:HK97 family phage portal protein
MSVFSKVASWFKRGLSSLIYPVGVAESYHSIDNERAIEEGYNSNTAVYSIVNRDAAKFATIPRFVYKKERKEEKAYSETVLENDLSKLLNRPNDHHSQDAFFYELRVYKKLLDEAFIWLNRGNVTQEVNQYGELQDRSSEAYAKMPVLEMYVLPANKVLVRPDPENLWGVLGYILDLDGTYFPLRKEDVIHWKGPNLSFDPSNRTHLRGTSPLTAGYKTLQSHNDATDAIVRMHKNDGAKGILTNETLDKMTPEQQSQIRRVVDAKVNNNDVKSAVATLQGKWAYHALNSGIDLHLLEAKELSWKELCFLLDVPYEFFNSDTTFANKEEAQKGWVNNTIVPACKQLDGELNRVLLKAFGLDSLAFIGCDYSEMPELQQDLLQLAQAMEKSPVTPNEWREAMGYEKINKPEMDEVWMPSGKQPLSQLNDAHEMEQITQDLMNSQIGKNTTNE